MSDAPTPPNTTTSPATPARLEFRIRVPVVPGSEPASLSVSDDDVAATRGMKVLHGILDRRGVLEGRGRRDVRGFSRPRINRLWLVSAVLVVFSCFAMIYGLTRNTDTAGEAHETDVVNDEYGNFEPEVPAQASAPQITPMPAAAPAPAPATIDAPPKAAAVQAAVYHTAKSLKAKTAWFDGTIVPDDTPNP